MNTNSKSTGLGRAVLAFFLCTAIASLAQGAVSLGNSTVQLGGFFSQGYIEGNNNNYPFEDKGGTFDFREMGVNVSSTIGAHLRVGGQLFAQRLGNYGEDQVKLDWAQVDYNFRQEFGIRLGRVKYPKGLYNEALDLDSVRPFVFLPMALYNPVVRDFNSALNGGMIYGSVELGKAGSLDYKVFYGNIPMSPKQGVADFFNTTGLYTPAGVNRVGMDYSAGGQIFWSTPVTGLKLGYSYSFFKHLVAAGKFAFFPAGDVVLDLPKYNYHTFSAEYIRDSWTFVGEYQQVSGDTSIVNPFSASAGKSEVANWYVSAARRLNDKFEVGTYYSSQENTNPSAGSLAAANHNRDWAFSLRYDLNEHVLFKAEYHYVDGRYNVFNTTRTPNPAVKDNSSFFAVKTTLSF
jgi:hypothetical protein